MEKRRWEDLDGNILIKIFKRLHHNHLFLRVSSVCRAWQIACWEILFWNSEDVMEFVCTPNFSRKLGPSMDYSKMEIKAMQLMKSIFDGDAAHGTPLKGWNQSLSAIWFPEDFQFSDRILLFIAQRTPNLKFIHLRSSDRITERGFSQAIPYWKEIKSIVLGPIDGGCYTNIFQDMGKHWDKLDHLSIYNNKELESLFFGNCVLKEGSKTSNFPHLAKFRKKVGSDGSFRWSKA